MDDKTYDRVNTATADIQFENTDVILVAVQALGIDIQVYAPPAYVGGPPEFMGYVLIGTGDAGDDTYWIYGPDGDPVFMDDEVADQLDAAFKEAGVE